jgi:hypothetical protein
VISYSAQAREYVYVLDPSLPDLDREVMVFEADGSTPYRRMYLHQFERFCTQSDDWRQVSLEEVPGPVRAAIAALRT